MASTADRLRNLISENIEVDGKPVDVPDDMGFSLTAAGVSSLDLVAFGKLVSQEFGVSFELKDCTEIDSLGKLVAFIEAKAA